MQPIRSALMLTSTIIALATAACSGGNEEGADTVASAPGSPSAAGATGAAGMDHSQMAGMNHGPAKDADHGFLRMMSDHHEGLVAMATEAMNKASTPEAQGDAHNLHTEQAAERDTMVSMIRSFYAEAHTPTVMPKNKAQNDSLRALSGKEYDRKFYQLVVAHHREGIAMMDSVMASLTRPEVKRMTEKMRAEQQKEIQEFQRKSGT